MDSTTVDFGADDVRPAIDLLTRFATPGSEIASWVHVEPVGAPDQALPEVSGFLGRRKRAAPPSVQVVYVDPARGPGRA
ncbi:MAG TPA: hypothetical protein VMM13_12120 [Euzebya sp.]|nr:hypothetical protein [Euzebya sp.]